MEYKKTGGGTQALLGNAHAGWIMTTLNGKWTYSIKKTGKNQGLFNSKVAAIDAFEKHYIAIGIAKTLVSIAVLVAIIAVIANFIVISA